MKGNEEKYSWKSIQPHVDVRDAVELRKLLKELYDLNAENRRFLSARFLPTEFDLGERKRLIAKALYNDFEMTEKVDFRSAKKVISDYRKARENSEEVAELMVFYVETANQLTLDYGDMWEQFYTSIENMFLSTARHLKEMQKKGQAISHFKERLGRIVNSTRNIGWGYHDTLSDIYHEAFG